uniref:Uncharacterized protein n=1 Tax=Candidatus Kentrum sp. MB TaxID=2138164 RepID=A0A450XPK9_9GAMM|nr:MAG: hypothetical protein BECKMB1821G_GA0114241_102421 [Candidatus Kentron sp. MB]VFK31197.1 MAG: hypothetical protein BECKMB1821I_GA0114274_102120 [Candidatus Kentron sp. MB]VFK75387.1 MAG: hypothetical protein BECKMB1821H_GA0114242_102121 [Candidatus Kentron sp. MB]
MDEMLINEFIVVFMILVFVIGMGVVIKETLKEE